MPSDVDRERVRLRGLRPDDGPEFIERVRASTTLHGPWTDLPETPERFAEFVTRSQAPTEAVYLIVRIEDGAMAGIANLSQIFLGNFRSAYLG